jgi:hypothetical protein
VALRVYLGDGAALKKLDVGLCVSFGKDQQRGTFIDMRLKNQDDWAEALL